MDGHGERFEGENCVEGWCLCDLRFMFNCLGSIKMNIEEHRWLIMDMMKEDNECGINDEN